MNDVLTHVGDGDDVGDSEDSSSSSSGSINSTGNGIGSSTTAPQ